jgi:hypothetical protein
MGWPAAFALIGTLTGASWAIAFMVWATMKYGPKK